MTVILLVTSYSSRDRCTGTVPGSTTVIVSFSFGAVTRGDNVGNGKKRGIITGLASTLGDNLRNRTCGATRGVVRGPSRSNLSFASGICVFVAPRSGTFTLLTGISSRNGIRTLLRTLGGRRVYARLGDRDKYA